MSNLKPLKWIDVVDSIGVYCEGSYIKDAVAYCSTPIADYVVRQDDETLKYRVNYGGRTINEYDTLQDAKDWCEFTHYKDKMQPYVTPHVGWISVDDRLPTLKEPIFCIGIDDEGRFLSPIVATVHEDGCFICGYTFGGDRKIGFYMETKPTHWMPLPKLPSEVTR